jgi:hypothetical protein
MIVNRLQKRATTEDPEDTERKPFLVRGFASVCSVPSVVESFVGRGL